MRHIANSSLGVQLIAQQRSYSHSAAATDVASDGGELRCTIISLRHYPLVPTQVQYDRTRASKRFVCVFALPPIGAGPMHEQGSQPRKSSRPIQAELRGPRSIKHRPLMNSGEPDVAPRCVQGKHICGRSLQHVYSLVVGVRRKQTRPR
jgi:hypothetical protein